MDYMVSPCLKKTKEKKNFLKKAFLFAYSNDHGTQTGFLKEATVARIFSILIQLHQVNLRAEINIYIIQEREKMNLQLNNKAKVMP
jgi:hypothetical protein